MNYHRNHILIWILTAFFLSLYAGLFALSVTVTLLYIFTIVSAFQQRKNIKKLFSSIPKYLVLVIAYPIVVICRDIFSNTIVWSAFFGEINKYLPFLVLPILIIVNKNFFLNNYFRILHRFFIISILAACFCLLVAIFKGYVLNSFELNYWYFSYNLFAHPVHVHPIYLAIFFSFAMVTGVYLTYKAKISKIVLVSGNSILFLSLVLLSSRTALVAYIISFIVMYGLLYKPKLRHVWIILAISACGAFVVISNPIILNRYSRALNNANVYSGLQLRLDIWKCAYEVIKENNLILGTGYSTTQNELNQCYKENQLITPFYEEYHAHNQYIQSGLFLGLIGVGLITLLILYPLRIALQRPTDNSLLIGIVILIFINGLTESIFERMWGRIIFVFFISILILIAEDKNKTLPSIQKEDK